MNAGGTWKKCTLRELFGDATRGRRLKKDDRIEGNLTFITAGETNTGISGFVGNKVQKFPANTITIDMFGSAKYRNYEYGADDHIAVIHTQDLPKLANIFITSAIHKASYNGQFDYGRNFYASDADMLIVFLPIGADSSLALQYMASYIELIERERFNRLTAYLQHTKLTDCKLNETETKLLQDFRILRDTDHKWKEFTIKYLFDNIEQGSRLTKADQIEGDLPFVMSGTTDTGVTGYIGNDVKEFPKESITIDIFGNVFYRNYDYSISDDVGAFWNTANSKNKPTTKNELLFVSSALQRALTGVFSYGSKLRASKSYNLVCSLPAKDDGTPDYEYMNTLMSAIHKTVIKGVVNYVEKSLKN